MEIQNLIGRRFGKLVVLSYVTERTDKRKARWQCKCDCGKEHIVQGNHLKSGNTKSCGCLHKLQGKDSPFFKGYGEIPLDYFSTVRRGSKGGGKFNRREKEFNITIEYIWGLFLKQNRKCALSNLNIGFEGTRLENKCTSTSRFTASLDRINSSLGYIEGNVQWIHKDINIMKNSFDLNDFLKYCRLITEHTHENRFIKN